MKKMFGTATVALEDFDIGRIQQLGLETEYFLGWLFHPYDPEHDYTVLIHGKFDFKELHQANSACRVATSDETLLQLNNALNHFVDWAEENQKLFFYGNGSPTFHPGYNITPVKGYGNKPRNERGYPYTNESSYSVDGLLLVREALVKYCRLLPKQAANCDASVDSPKPP